MEENNLKPFQPLGESTASNEPVDSGEVKPFQTEHENSVVQGSKGLDFRKRLDIVYGITLFVLFGGYVSLYLYLLCTRHRLLVTSFLWRLFFSELFSRSLHQWCLKKREGGLNSPLC